MRFCPFCSAENLQEATHCGACARKLPPVAPRRRRTTATPAVAAEEGGARKRSEPARADATGGESARPDGSGAQVLSSLGPGSRRRPPPPQSARPPGVPARRKSDLKLAVAPLDGERTGPTPAELGERGARAVSGAAEAAAGNGMGDAAAGAGAASTDGGASEPSDRRERASGGGAAEPSAPVERRERASDGGEAKPSALVERREHTLPEPPPTRVGAEPYRPSALQPIPDAPEPGLFASARYAISFARARWQRRGAIRRLEEEIRDDTASLDTVLGELGREVRALGIDNRVLRAENEAIEEAERRRKRAERECAELENRQAEENARSAEIEVDKQAKVTEAETSLERAQRELASLEAQRRSLRDKRKVIERQQKGSLKAAEDRDEQAAKAPMGESRSALRRAAEDLRRDAAGLDPERQDLERRLAALERPISQGMAKVETLRAELESCRQSLNDAHEGHRHRLAELEAEQGRKSRELALSDAEIQRRLITLGTLVNLNRIERAEFAERYAQIDNLRGAIGARSTEIDRLSAEREAYDRGSLVRGVAVLGGGVVGLLTLIVVLLAVL